MLLTNEVCWGIVYFSYNIVFLFDNFYFFHLPLIDFQTFFKP